MLSGKSNDPTVITAVCCPAGSGPEGGPRLVPDMHPAHTAVTTSSEAVRYVARCARVLIGRRPAGRRPGRRARARPRWNRPVRDAAVLFGVELSMVRAPLGGGVPGKSKCPGLRRPW